MARLTRAPTASTATAMAGLTSSCCRTSPSASLVPQHRQKWDQRQAAGPGSSSVSCLQRLRHLPGASPDDYGRQEAVVGPEGEGEQPARQHQRIATEAPVAAGAALAASGGGQGQEVHANHCNSSQPGRTPHTASRMRGSVMVVRARLVVGRAACLTVVCGLCHEQVVVPARQHGPAQHLLQRLLSDITSKPPPHQDRDGSKAGGDGHGSSLPQQLVVVVAG